MNRGQFLFLVALSTISCVAQASFYGDTVEGQLSDPFTSQLFDNDSALVGDGDEFSGFDTIGSGSATLQYYANVGQTSVTIGVRHLGPFGLVFNANPFTFEFSGLDWGGPGQVQGFQLTSVFAQTLWPDDQDPNARWIGWGQDTPVAPPWDPLWDASTGTLTIVATNGFTIPPNFDVYATFDAVIPVPPALPLMMSALALLSLVRRRVDQRS